LLQRRRRDPPEMVLAPRREPMPNVVRSTRRPPTFLVWPITLHLPAPVSPMPVPSSCFIPSLKLVVRSQAGRENRIAMPFRSYWSSGLCLLLTVFDHVRNAISFVPHRIAEPLSPPPPFLPRRASGFSGRPRRATTARFTLLGANPAAPSFLFPLSSSAIFVCAPRPTNVLVCRVTAAFCRFAPVSLAFVWSVAARPGPRISQNEVAGGGSMGAAN